jgi:hypothetical protein
MLITSGKSKLPYFSLLRQCGLVAAILLFVTLFGSKSFAQSAPFWAPPAGSTCSYTYTSGSKNSVEFAMKIGETTGLEMSYSRKSGGKKS